MLSTLPPQKSFVQSSESLSYGKNILAFFTGRSILSSGPSFPTEFVCQKICYGAFLSLTSFTEIFVGRVLQNNGYMVIKKTRVYPTTLLLLRFVTVTFFSELQFVYILAAG